MCEGFDDVKLARAYANVFRMDGRLIAAFIVLYTVAVWAATVIETGSIEKGWQRLDVNTMAPNFADLDAVTAGAECVRNGYDIIVENPCDQWSRPAMYPRIWQLGGPLGVSHADTVWIGLLGAGLFYVMLLLLYAQSPLGWFEGVLLGFACISRPVLLALERGNIDVLVFLVFAAGIFISRSSKRWVTLSLFLFASILKLYPAVLLAMSSMLPRWRRAGLICLALSLLYFYVTRDDIREIAKTAPQMTEVSFGIKIAPKLLSEKFGASQIFERLAYPLFLLATAAIGHLLYHSGRLVRSLEESRFGFGFLAAGAIYTGTFLIGFNFDYRLIFLLPIFSFLFEKKAFFRDPARLAFSLSAMILLVTSCRKSGFKDEFAAWLLATMFSGCFLAIAVTEAKKLIENFNFGERQTGEKHGA